VFRQGGRDEPSLTATWENHLRLGPLLMPTQFRSQDGRLRIWFSDLSVKLTGSDRFLPPE
ncbi:MAG: hypothetical protein JSW50_16455, partial [Candidatus Latescibacterota bacterium]